MRIRVRLQIEDENGTVVADDEVPGLAKPADRLEDLGLSLEEARASRLKSESGVALERLA